MEDECRRGRRALLKQPMGRPQEGRSGKDPSSSPKGCVLQSEGCVFSVELSWVCLWRCLLPCTGSQKWKNQCVHGKNGLLPYSQCLQPDPTFLENTNLPFKLTWGWAFRGAGSGQEGFNCKAVHEHPLFSVLSCSFFAPCFTQEEHWSFSAQSLIPVRGSDSVRQSQLPSCVICGMPFASCIAHANREVFLCKVFLYWLCSSWTSRCTVMTLRRPCLWKKGWWDFVWSCQEWKSDGCWK